MKVLQISVTVNTGAGRIVEDIGKVLIANGHQSFVAYGRIDRPSVSNLIKIGTSLDIYLHGLISLFFDRHGFGSYWVTKRLVKKIKKLDFDLIILHNIHGYYIHVGLLFEYLRSFNKPILWILLDCWAFTGHCSYFDDISCEKWVGCCSSCPKSRSYPKSLFLDQSKANYRDKKFLFSGLPNLQLIVHSSWLGNLIKRSFLNDYSINIIPSGIDLSVFRLTPANVLDTYKLNGKRIILGCASIWSERKGINDFYRLRSELDDSFHIVLIGVTLSQKRDLPSGITGIFRTESVNDLVEWYNAASVFVNPTYSDNFPATNLEALACGTPVITYNTGGSPEAVNEIVGRVIEKGNIKLLKEAVIYFCKMNKRDISYECREHAVRNFNKDKQFSKYLTLFSQNV